MGACYFNKLPGNLHPIMILILFLVVAGEARPEYGRGYYQWQGGGGYYGVESHEGGSQEYAGHADVDHGENDLRTKKEDAILGVGQDNINFEQAANFRHNGVMARFQHHDGLDRKHIEKYGIGRSSGYNAKKKRKGVKKRKFGNQHADKQPVKHVFEYSDNHPYSFEIGYKMEHPYGLGVEQQYDFGVEHNHWGHTNDGFKISGVDNHSGERFSQGNHDNGMGASYDNRYTNDITVHGEKNVFGLGDHGERFGLDQANKGNGDSDEHIIKVGDRNDGAGVREGNRVYNFGDEGQEIRLGNSNTEFVKEQCNECHNISDTKNQGVGLGNNSNGLEVEQPNKGHGIEDSEEHSIRLGGHGESGEVGIRLGDHNYKHGVGQDNEDRGIDDTEDEGVGHSGHNGELHIGYGNKEHHYGFIDPHYDYTDKQDVYSNEKFDDGFLEDYSGEKFVHSSYGDGHKYGFDFDKSLEVVFPA